MKRLFVSLIIMLVLLTGCGNDKKVDSSLGNRVVDENLEVADYNGNTVDYKELTKADLTMINIWGTFCGPCIKEMPYLEQLNNKYDDNRFRVVGIAVDITNKNGKLKDAEYADAKEILNKTGATYLQLIPDAVISSTILKDITSVPQTIFINSDGYQVGPTYYGAKSYEDWETIVEEMLK